MRHPAMLIYLDNAQSVGPDSPVGQRPHRGLNENLARECMELHTVSPPAGYTQADVTVVRQDPDRLVDRPERRPARLPLPPARARTGRPDRDGPQLPARRGRRHRGAARSSPIIRRPTASSPPSWCAISSPTIRRRTRCARSRRVLRDTGGDLGAAAAALGRRSTPPGSRGTKLRTPHGLRHRQRARAGPAAATRARHAAASSAASASRSGPHRRRTAGPTGPPTGPRPRRCCAASTGLAGSPAASASRDAVEIADATLGPLLRPDTREAVSRAGSRRDAMTLLLTTPEFQRR